VINAIKFSIEEIEASDQYFDHTGSITQHVIRSRPSDKGAPLHRPRRRDLISIIEWRARRFKSMLIGKAKCVDDHFFRLLRLVVVTVLKSKKRGEYIHIKRFELVGYFFQGHRNASACYRYFASL
jgi:hypothetical protein